MFAILNDYYEPAYSLHESQDMKSTQELLEEMECMQEVYPWEINKLMADGGYKMQYTGSGYAWLLKKRK
jgi:hypothetical protein